jgi:predicted TIM-barrel fold metal-dependent hydrolase
VNLTEVDREDAPQEDVLDPELPIVDPHHHLWPTGYRIPYDSAALHADLARGHNVEATVFVECMTSFRPDGDEALRPVGETEFVLRDCPTVAPGDATGVAAGIVGWADLTRPDDVGRTLDGHLEAGQERFKGVRFNVVWHERHAHHAGREVPRHFLLDDDYRRGLREVERRGLTYDVWLFHAQLPELADTIGAFPDLTFVVNHLGGPVPEEQTPESRAAIFDEWRRNLADIAQRPNAVLKVGGVGMPVYGFGLDKPTRPRSTELADAWKPSVETAIELFGPDRCMFESNFPVDKQSFSYDALWNAFKLLSAGYSPDERALLFSGTARRVYRLDAA